MLPQNKLAQLAKMAKSTTIKTLPDVISYLASVQREIGIVGDYNVAQLQQYVALRRFSCCHFVRSAKQTHSSSINYATLTNYSIQTVTLALRTNVRRLRSDCSDLKAVRLQVANAIISFYSLHNTFVVLFLLQFYLERAIITRTPALPFPYSW
jgi:hypothetical protein